MVRTWSMECAKAGITVNGIIPVAATAMTATIPAFRPYVEAWGQSGEPFPAWLRRGEGFGTPADAAGLVTFLASAAAAGVTGQCIGIGGDRLSLWSHPQEIATAFHDGGWDAAAIADAWPATLGQHAQTVGVPLPAAPGAQQS
jgi:NAD(P)-dependent dehydrogenase (short-subunit alcohol dehydrogenase family)